MYLYVLERPSWFFFSKAADKDTDSTAELLLKKLLLCPRPQEGLLLCLLKWPVPKVRHLTGSGELHAHVSRNTACQQPDCPLYTSFLVLSGVVITMQVKQLRK